MNIKLLKNFGLSKKEIDVYKFLCTKGLQSIFSIAKGVGIHRPQLYDILPQMVERGLVEERQVGKRMQYQAAEPRVLYDIWQRETTGIETVIDELQTVYESTQKKPDITFVLGQRGFKTVFDDIADVVPKGGEILRYSARAPTDTNYSPSAAYKKRRALGHFQRMAITSERKGVQKSRRLDRFVKVIPSSYDLFEDNVSQSIYEDRIVFTDHDNETTFIIKSEKLAGMQKKIFKLLWKYLKEPEKYNK